MGPAGSKSNGFLARLARDQRGNTLAIIAMALFPLAGMIGGGLDLSRAYLVKTRLSQACDAGVLAGRKAMASGGSITQTVKDEVQKYANFNFPSGYMGTATYTQTTWATPTLGANDQVLLTLTSSVPTTVMKLFKKETIPVTVSCSARNDYANIDIVLVLDTTGSMACKPERDASDCSDWINDYNRSGKTTVVDGRTVTFVREEGAENNNNISRMQALRAALTNLQAQMATIEAQFNTAPAATRKRIRWAIVPFSQMTNPGFSRDASNTTLYSRHPTWFNTTGSYRDSSSSPTTVTHGSNADQIATWMNNTWDGCVEELSTSNSITPTSGHSIPNNLPSGANDLRFDTVPSSTATRWTVADPSRVGSSQYACPKAMRELQTMSGTDFNNYFAASTGFLANGGTYLDLGMLWAARLLSRGTGLWSASNPVIYNTYPVSRYVILMTDGEMDTGNTGYGAYAQERWWKRVAADGTVDTNKKNHTQRWLMTCAAIKNMDVKIFAISFGAGSSLSADMTGCSSGAGFGYKADNAAGLNQAFRDIGETIGSLRLSQ
ncbi:MAG: pilus assembly protein [Sphingobium sp.]|nr:pilus assembly protein [Sphingobium sp.]